jgi:hypothetical protein
MKVYAKGSWKANRPNDEMYGYVYWKKVEQIIKEHFDTETAKIIKSYCYFDIHKYRILTTFHVLKCFHGKRKNNQKIRKRLKELNHTLILLKNKMKWTYFPNLEKRKNLSKVVHQWCRAINKLVGVLDLDELRKVNEEPVTSLAPLYLLHIMAWRKMGYKSSAKHFQLKKLYPLPEEKYIIEDRLNTIETKIKNVKIGTQFTMTYVEKQKNLVVVPGCVLDFVDCDHHGDKVYMIKCFDDVQVFYDKKMPDQFRIFRNCDKQNFDTCEVSMPWGKKIVSVYDWFDNVNKNNDASCLLSKQTDAMMDEKVPIEEVKIPEQTGDIYVHIYNKPFFQHCQVKIFKYLGNQGNRIVCRKLFPKENELNQESFPLIYPGKMYHIKDSMIEKDDGKFLKVNCISLPQGYESHFSTHFCHSFKFSMSLDVSIFKSILHQLIEYTQLGVLGQSLIFDNGEVFITSFMFPLGKEKIVVTDMLKKISMLLPKGYFVKKGKSLSSYTEVLICDFP